MTLKALTLRAGVGTGIRDGTAEVHLLTLRAVGMWCSLLLVSCGPGDPAFPTQFRCNSPAERTSDVAGVLCRIQEGGRFPGVSAALVDADGGELFFADYGAFTPGARETDYLGTMNNSGAGRGEDYVAACSGSSGYTPEPCTLELLEIERGAELVPSSDPDSELMVERGSYVRMRVSCPEEGLYSPGADDYGPTRRPFSPNEFEMEARDCETDREP